MERAPLKGARFFVSRIATRRRSMFVLRGLLLLALQAVLVPGDRRGDESAPRRLIDERVRLALLACGELREAFEQAAVRIIRSRIPAMIRQEHIDALNLRNPRRARHGFL